MRALLYVPLFAILLVLYNVIMIFSDVFKTNPDLFSIPLMANDERFGIKASELFAMIGMILLYLEILKATRTAQSTIADHMLSTAVFVVCIVEFIVVAGAGTSSFMMLTLLSLIDVVAGFTISISTARRDIAFGTHDV